MTIDEAIRRIDEHNYIHQHKEPRAIYITEAFDVAVETMRKYQQIEQIIDHYKNNVRDKVTNENMEKILEVVEDGKIDRLQ